MARHLPAFATVNMAGVLKEFKQYYLDAVATQVEDERTHEERLRVSGFPYCPLKHAYKQMTAHVKKDIDMSGRYYVEVGTVAHELMQDWMGRAGQIYGQWKCRTPGCKGFRAISRKNKCPICKGRMNYEELTVKAFKNVSGHLDGIWRSKNGEYYVIDYKTSSARIIQSQKSHGMLPYHHNVAQIRAYCALIELMFDIKISGWILMYVSRDSPMDVVYATGKPISKKEKARYLKKIKKWDRQWDEVLAVTTFKGLMDIVAQKPCDSYEFYKEHYDSYTPCPLSKGHLCFNPRQLKEFLKLTWFDRPPGMRLPKQ
jgi:hypothetical protein